MKKINIAMVLAAALLLSVVGSTALYVLYQQELRHNEELTEQIEELTKRERRSTVMQSVNAQMEQIATQERRVSDMQREEAVQQRKVAEEERQNAERQRHAAEEQRQNALAAERKAVEASDVAQRQRTIAEQQRAEAELAKRVTDTLSYVALARNLGTQAVTQLTTGNEELADLLAYAAYIFTKRYQGDVYNPTIYQALSMTSASIRKWNVAHGALMKMWSLPGTKSFVTVSKYGEIMKHTKTDNGNLLTQTIMQNNAYDFRDLVIDDSGSLYAISYSGHLVYGKPDDLHTIAVEGATNAIRLFSPNDGQLLIVTQRSVHLLDTNTMQQIKKLPLSFKCATADEDDHQLILFDTMGHAYTIDNKAATVKPRQLPFTPQPITSYTYGWMKEFEAFGTADGIIFVIDNNGGVHRLVGHGSRVSMVKFDGNRLYSTSYDGTVRFWPFTRQKTESMTIAETRQWVMSFFFDETMKYIWTGDQNGNLTETLIDAHLMAEIVHDKLKRELTQEEWQYYLGRNIPYERLK